MPAAGRLHDGVTAADVSAQDDVRVALAEEVDDLGVSGSGGEHQGGLVVVVEGGAVGLAAEGEEQLHDGEVAQRGGEVQVRVRQAVWGGVWVVEELRVRVKDSLDQEGIVGVDRPSQSGRGVDPEGGSKERWRVSLGWLSQLWVIPRHEAWGCG